MSQKRPSPATPALPNSFTRIRDLLDRKVKQHAMTNMMGLVTRLCVPVPTRGSDWKCRVHLIDQSIVDEVETDLELHIFRPKEQIPQIGYNDVLILHSVKVQFRDMENVSLLSHYSTRISVYSANKIPRPPADASCALLPPSKPSDKPPNKQESEFVPHIYHGLKKTGIPDESEFEVMKVQSANIREKFSLLGDVRDGKFCNIIAQVVKEPYDMADKFTLWVSDFTENLGFHDFPPGNMDASEGRDGDPYGYSAKFMKDTAANAWSGPTGRRSIQITCYEPHASAIRARNIGTGSWVSIRNLQIKHGHSQTNLEGFLRGDQNSFGQEKIGVLPLNPLQEDCESIDPRLKEAIRRKRDFERSRNEMSKDIESAAQAGQKRRADTSLKSETKDNSKERRKRSRKAKQNKKTQQEYVDVVTEIPGLNPAVKCENDNKCTSSVKDMLEIAFYDTVIEGNGIKLRLPFVNANYRANVRVVDFKPPRLEDFARLKKKTTEYAVLSDHEDSGTESDLDSQHGMMAPSADMGEWEWRFYLQVEDAVVQGKQRKERLWVAVDNPSAQNLLNLDASNLRHDKANREAARQKLSILWGNLEEYKVQKQEEARRAIEANKVPVDSSDEERETPQVERTEPVTSRPFPCCIRQYGFRVKEPDAAKADAGQGHRWQRMYGLFGTRIPAS